MYIDSGKRNKLKKKNCTKSKYVLMNITESINIVIYTIPSSTLHDHGWAVIFIAPLDGVHEEAEQKHPSEDNNTPVEIVHCNTALTRPQGPEKSEARVDKRDDVNRQSPSSHIPLPRWETVRVTDLLVDDAADRNDISVHQCGYVQRDNGIECCQGSDVDQREGTAEEAG